MQIEPVTRRPHPQAHRPITDQEFAQAVETLVAAALPPGWVGPSEDDVDEAPPGSTGELAARFAGRDTVRGRFGFP